MFDPARISCRDMLEFFLQIHDPSTVNRGDVGTSYWVGSFLTTSKSESPPRTRSPTPTPTPMPRACAPGLLSQKSWGRKIWEADPKQQDYVVRHPGGRKYQLVCPKWKLPRRGAPQVP